MRTNAKAEESGKESLLVSEIMPPLDSRLLSQEFFDVTKKQTTWNQFSQKNTLHMTKRNNFLNSRVPPPKSFTPPPAGMLGTTKSMK
jgi:hypothetical protein